MKVQLKKSIFIKGGTDRIVLAGTFGVQRDNMIMFYDSTKTRSVAFDIETCETDKALFQVYESVSRNYVDFKRVEKILSEKFSPDISSEIISSLLPYVE